MYPLAGMNNKDGCILSVCVRCMYMYMYPLAGMDCFLIIRMDVIFLLGMDERFKEYPKLKELIRLKVSWL